MNSPSVKTLGAVPPDVAMVTALLERHAWVVGEDREDPELHAALRGVDFITLLGTITTAKALGRQDAVIPLYMRWLDLHAGNAHLYAAWFNLGVELAAAGGGTAAQTAYRNALLLKPDFHSAAVNLGLELERTGQTDAALEAWERALQPDEARVTLLNHRGRLLETLKRFDEAEEALFASLLTRPHQPDALQHWIHIRLRMCAWPVYGGGIPGLVEEDLLSATRGLSALALFDDIERLDRSVAEWVRDKLPPAPVRLSPEEGYAHDRIRLGYLSSDYCLHPVSLLVAELFERHDRSRFEVIGYCAGRDDGSEVRQRVLGAFDHWVSVAGLNDEEAARRIRADEIDILIDLNGMTGGTRLGALRWKPAPVQITYLGFIGALPLPELDYVLCDTFVVPPALAGQYRPQPLYLPRSYQVNDSKLPVGAPETRADAGLPEDRFVYCCFSNNYKITEPVFDAWMRILARVENAVLWLLADNPWAERNMRAEAERRGIDPGRLFFAGRVSPPQYLSRLALADLFLDTYPYNSGTTASDALRMGLPLVTRAGNSFSSRMAGSLLRAVGLEAGIVGDLDDYVELAVALGADAQAHATFRGILEGGAAWRRTLGDAGRFTQELEELYASVLRRPGKEEERMGREG